MKKFWTSFVTFLLLALLLTASVAAADVVYVDWAGNDANAGATVDAAKKTPAAAAEVLPNGGILLVTGKAYTHKTGNFPATAGTLTITSAYGGKDYKNPEPANNPACAFKMGSGVKLTFTSDVVFDDIILFQENGQNTIVVANGATLTVNDNVVTMSNHAYYWKIIVEEGGKAVINGGTFSSISGAGDITVGEGATVLEGDYAKVLPADGKPETVFLQYGASNANDGLTASAPKTSFGNGKDTGAISLLPYGGTLVAVGKAYVGVNYTLPAMTGPLTITSVHDGVDYKNPEPANNPACAFKMGSGVKFTVNSDVIFDDIILFQENNQNTIRVTDGATLTVTDKAVLMSNHDYHYIIELDKGAVAILSEEAQKRFTVQNNGGTLITYGAPASAATEIRLTIGEKYGIVNGRTKVLDAAPIIRFDRTMLPVRFVAENLGGTVGWDGATSTVTVTGEGISIAIRIGASTAEINGKTVTLDSPAFIESSRTYLPVRVVAEAMGATVAWDGATSTATLTK